MRSAILCFITLVFPGLLLAELPQSLDEYLFGQTGGTNYVQWMKAEGEVCFVRPFVVFDKAIFRSSRATNDLQKLHYSIAMQKTINLEDYTNTVQTFMCVQRRLTREFRSAKFDSDMGSLWYYSTCSNIDCQGWNVKMSVRRWTEDSFSANIFFFNPLHKEGKFASCEDFENSK